MKKAFIALFSVVLVLTACFFGMFEASADVEGAYTYTVEGGKATITAFDKSVGGDVVIPSELGGYPVTVIGDEAFAYCDNMVSVTIPEGVTHIGKNAFFADWQLTEIVIPSTLKKSDEGAFNGVVFESVYITDIAAWCAIEFFDLSSNPAAFTQGLYLNGEFVSSLDIPDGITKIGDYAFVQYNKLDRVKFPDSLVEIGDYAFMDCTSIFDMKYPKYLEIIGDGAFYGCERLPDMLLPESVKHIGSVAFRGVTSGQLYLGPNIEYIGGGAFLYCTGLTEVTVPDGITRIEGGTFGNCSNLTRIVLPESVTYIGPSAFEWCSKLININIPQGVDYIGSCAFNRCESIVSLDIPEGITEIFESTFALCKKLVDFEIPSTVKAIGQDAFYMCEGMTGITIPEGVKTIGRMAFCNSPNLLHIDLADSVEYIGPYAFSGTAFYNSPANWENNVLYMKSFLVEMHPDYFEGSYTVKAGTKHIAPSAIAKCSKLTELILPEGLVSIGEYGISECRNLEKVVLPSSLEIVHSDAFYETKIIDLYVGDLASWCNVTFGNVFSNPFYVAVRDYFDGQSISELVIPAEIDVIKDYAFMGLDSIKTVDLSGGITSIGKYAFYHSGLTEVIIPSGVELGENAFAGSWLKTVVFPPDIEYIGGSLFSRCSSLKNVMLPESLKVIELAVFEGCSSLEKIVIPDGTEIVGENVFDRCTSLKEVQLPASLKEVKLRGFVDCTALTDVYYGGTEEMWGQIVIKPQNECLLNAAIHYESAFPKTGDLDGDGKLNTRDAIYLLYSILFNKTDYPISQPVDYNGDGRVNTRDAVYLLYHILFGDEDYPLKVQ